MFGHGPLNDSRAAQVYAANYCSKNWNQICELTSKDDDTNCIKKIITRTDSYS